MTEKEKMLAGLPYSAVDEQLLKEFNECKDVVHRYNALLPSERAERTARRCSSRCWDMWAMTTS